MNILHNVQARFRTALTGLVPDPEPFVAMVKAAQDPKHGDYQANCAMSLAKTLGLAQLLRLDEILERRRAVEAAYREHMLSFEGIKPPYRGPDVDQVNWMLYVVHLGKRFTASACAQVIDDLRTECIESALYCQPLHQQFHYTQQGWQRGRLPLAERIADRAIALPFHGGLDADHVKFIVKTLKDSSVNVGAGAAIY